VVQVRGYRSDLDEAWAEDLLARRLGGRVQARLGELVDLLDLDGLVAERDDGGRVGIVSYRRDGEDACELAGLVAERGQEGVGSALVAALRAAVRGWCTRIWLITTNDNLDALRFYQRRGFELRALHAGAVDEARQTLKPSLPLTGGYGIALRDEIELELRI